MDVEVTVEAEKRRGGLWLLWLAELAGLALLTYGLAAGEWSLSAAGVFLIVASYLLYRHNNRLSEHGGGDCAPGFSPMVDGGSDGGGC